MIYAVTAFDLVKCEYVEYVNLDAETEPDAVQKAHELSAIEGRSLCEFEAASFTEYQKRKAQDYFEQCRAYWRRNGDRENVATCKALYWDCFDVWNRDRSWDAGKREFAKQWRGYTPYSELPSPYMVLDGAV